MKHEPVKDHAERKRLLALIERCEKKQTMSDDLIRRSDAIRAVSKVDDYGDGIGFEVRSHCLVELELVPSADRPQGEWKGELINPLNAILRCSLCYYATVSKYNFCPNCGAHMKGADDETD